MRTNYLIFIFLCLPLSCNSEQSGGSVVQAYNDTKSDVQLQTEAELQTELSDSLSVTKGDARSKEILTVNPEWSLDLDERIEETSGLIFWDEALWTMNDDTDNSLYKLDMKTAEVISSHVLPRVVNQDWEEISQDEDFIYVGDFGNNMGNRKNLHILRIDKTGLKSGKPEIERIEFSYSDQKSFIRGSNQTDFDCEAFVVSTDSIYLFTKQWISGNTSLYVLPKQPGKYVAQKRAVYNIQGQVTGASYLEEERQLVLCGYAGLVQPFMHLFYDFQGDDFFTGKEKRINVALPFHQVEGIVIVDKKQFYLTNERTVVEPYVNLPPKLHYIDLSKLQED